MTSVVAANAFSGSLTNSLILAVVGGVVGYLSSYLIELTRARRSPRKELSWDLQVDEPKIRSAKRDDEHIKMTYDGRPVQRLVTAHYTVTNTGNATVKDHFLRFDFPKESTLLDVALDPAPKPEMAVGEVDGLQPGQRRFRIGHLDPGDSVTWRFVSDGGEWRSWTSVTSHNDEGRVPYERKGTARARADQEHVRPFLTYATLCAMTVVAFFITRALLGIVAAGAPAALVALTMVMMLVHLAPALRAISGMPARLTRPSQTEYHIGTLSTHGPATIGDNNTAVQHNPLAG